MKSGAGKAKLTEGQKHRLDVLGFLSEHCMHCTNEEMGRVGSYNIKYMYVFFLKMWVFFFIQFLVIFHGSPMNQSLLLLPHQV